MARAGARLKLPPGAEVDGFMVQLAHPHKQAIEAIRWVVRGAEPAIVEGSHAPMTMQDFA